MAELTHGFRIDEEACDGCLACMRACPTYAIRVKHGKARVLSESCIDCGSCLKACTRGAITATTRTFEEFDRFAFKVAIPSPVLYGHFPLEVRPEHVVDGLLAAGFDAVWDYGIEMRLVTLANVDYVKRWRGPRPVISIMCPVVVRLLQVSYPRMLEQLIRVHPPREIAGREAKRHYAQELGLPPGQVAAIYVTPCQARTVSILQPAEGGKSFLDGSVGLPQVYNTVLAEATEAAQAGKRRSDWSPVRSADVLRLTLRRPLTELLTKHRYLSVAGLPNVIRVFDDIERGKLKDFDYLECYACWGGCANGNLTVDNVYVTLAKLQSLINELPAIDPETEMEVARRYPHEDYSTPRAPEPRGAVVVGDLRERVRRKQEADKIAAILPGFDCGLCGAPGCAVLARDVAAGEAERGDCVFLSRRRLEELRRLRRRQP
jgi:Na+-translocating ferredoxin:NAD+ oxidoreductase RNF subunit RnfB